jgi:hypothetical protein
VSDHPVKLVVQDELERSRLTVFFRLLLALPHFFWLFVWTVAVVVAAFFGWLIALVTGRLPDGLHRFFVAYIRYVVHLGAYLSIAANPYPSFNAQPYTVDVELPDAERQPRWKAAVRLLLALPALLLSATLGSGISTGGFSRAGSDTGSEAEWLASSGIGGVAAVCAFLGWFAVLAVGRMPLGLRNLAAYGLGYTAQVYAYTLLVTGRYPNADPDRIGPTWELPGRPVRLEVTDDGRRSRLTVLFRLLLAIPHIVWLVLWSVAVFFAAIANGLVALVRGRSAEPLHRFLAAYVRYYSHVLGFVSVVANPFPGFTGEPGYPVDVVVDPPARQNRWKTFFRFFLAIPAFLISGALGAALAVAGILGWFAALVTGRMPTGLRNLGAVAIRYNAQTNAYWLVVTDAYPHASPALRPPPQPAPEPMYFDPLEPRPEAV